MNRFIKVKALEGELKRSEVRRGTGYKLTTKEFVLQREDCAYHILFEDILGLLPRDDSERYETRQVSGDTYVRTCQQFPSYKIVATRMKVHHHSGVDEKGPCTLHTELSDGLMSQFVTFLEEGHRPLA